LPANEIVDLKKQATEVHQLINGYIRYLRERKTGDNLQLHESSVAETVDDDLNAALSDTI
jgi:hypothetical protein